MTKLGKPRLKKMRRVGGDLSLTSGIRPLDTKCKINTRPGVHGAKRTRLSDYGVNLRSKQYVRFSYGILDKQLKRYHLEAVRQRKQNKDADYRLFILLESRLDVAVWRLGFATTLRAARQLVVHRKVYVDGVLQSKPRFEVKSGSVIEVRVKSAEQKGIIQASLEIMGKRPEVEWLSLQVDAKEGSFKGTFIRPPTLEELPSELTSRASEVIQYYSK